jgi:hypothetical protein
MLGVVVASAADRARDFRQEHRGDGDADNAERELVEAVRVVEPRHGARLQRGDDRADHDIDLHHAAGNHARPASRSKRRTPGVKRPAQPEASPARLPRWRKMAG